jgi:ribosome assembly protein 1
MMGDALVRVKAVPAGSVCAVGGLEGCVRRAATLSTTTLCPSMAALSFQAVPIVRVAVEARRPSDAPRLEDGLRLLSQADPAVEIHRTETGETHIVALGELHLEQCLQGLKERYACVAIEVGAPIVTFKETLALRADARSATGDASRLGSSRRRRTRTRGQSAQGAKDRSVQCVRAGRPAERWTAERRHRLTVRAEPLPEAVQAALAALGPMDDPECARTQRALECGGSTWAARRTRVVALGRPGSACVFLLGAALTGNDAVAMSGSGTAGDGAALATSHRASLVAGFRAASAAGPLCEEPMRGVAFILEAIEEVAPDSGQGAKDAAMPTGSAPDPTLRGVIAGGVLRQYGPLSGQLISACKEACRAAFLEASPRLMEPMYRCQTQCLQEHLGGLYAVIGRRRGRVMNERLVDGTDIFAIDAILPAAESFGFADELRKRTSGGAMAPQLALDGWRVLEVDPFYRPKTRSEREDFGETVHEDQFCNVAKRYIDAVRERKGLLTGKKVVVSAEKQRNLGRSK